MNKHVEKFNGKLMTSAVGREPDTELHRWIADWRAAYAEINAAARDGDIDDHPAWDRFYAAIEAAVEFEPRTVADAAALLRFSREIVTTGEAPPTPEDQMTADYKAELMVEAAASFLEGLEAGDRMSENDARILSLAAEINRIIASIHAAKTDARINRLSNEREEKVEALAALTPYSMAAAAAALTAALDEIAAVMGGDEAEEELGIQIGRQVERFLAARASGDKKRPKLRGPSEIARAVGADPLVELGKRYADLERRHEMLEAAVHADPHSSRGIYMKSEQEDRFQDICLIEKAVCLYRATTLDGAAVQLGFANRLLIELDELVRGTEVSRETKRLYNRIRRLLYSALDVISRSTINSAEELGLDQLAPATHDPMLPFGARMASFSSGEEDVEPQAAA
jgi:hypothetical protein